MALRALLTVPRRLGVADLTMVRALNTRTILVGAVAQLALGAVASVIALLAVTESHRAADARKVCAIANLLVTRQEIAVLAFLADSVVRKTAVSNISLQGVDLCDTEAASIRIGKLVARLVEVIILLVHAPLLGLSGFLIVLGFPLLDFLSLLDLSGFAGRFLLSGFLRCRFSVGLLLGLLGCFHRCSLFRSFNSRLLFGFLSSLFSGRSFLFLRFTLLFELLEPRLLFHCSLMNSLLFFLMFLLLSSLLGGLL